MTIIAESNPPPYPADLRPDHKQSLEIDGISYSVPGVTLTLDQWTGLPVQSRFGGKGLIDFEGKPMFAEFVVQRMAVAAGWSARWVSTYASTSMKPRFMTDWIGDASIGGQSRVPIENLECEEVLSRITAKNGDSFSGCWDVLIWRQSQIMFVELKRTKHDHIRATQRRWLRAGLEAGLSLDNFLIAQWDYS